MMLSSANAVYARMHDFDVAIVNLGDPDDCATVNARRAWTAAARRLNDHKEALGTTYRHFANAQARHDQAAKSLKAARVVLKVAAGALADAIAAGTEPPIDAREHRLFASALETAHVAAVASVERLTALVADRAAALEARHQQFAAACAAAEAALSPTDAQP